jgi:hypothetical protein
MGPDLLYRATTSKGGTPIAAAIGLVGLAVCGLSARRA